MKNEGMERVFKAFKQHAKKEFPKECCGLVIVFKGALKYVPCYNKHPSPENDVYLDELDWVKAEAQGEVVGFCHSHPRSSSHPSEIDIVGHSRGDIDWWILGEDGDIFHMPPTEGSVQIYGRKWVHGVQDCWTLVQDIYKTEFDIVLPNFPRIELWWEKGFNLYEDNMGKAGFKPVNFMELQYGDMIVMCIGSHVANHGGVYVGGNKVAHHLTGRLSSIDIYGNYLRERTLYTMRHESRR